MGLRGALPALVFVLLLSTSVSSSSSSSTPTSGLVNEHGVQDHAAGTPAAAAAAAAASAAALHRLFSEVDRNADGELEATELQAFAGSSFTSAEEGWGSTAAVSCLPACIVGMGTGGER